MILNCGADGVCNRILSPEDDIVHEGWTPLANQAVYVGEAITYARLFEQNLHHDEDVFLMKTAYDIWKSAGLGSPHIGVDIHLILNNNPLNLHVIHSPDFKKHLLRT